MRLYSLALAGFEPKNCMLYFFMYSVVEKATLSIGPLPITNIERSNLIKYPQFFDKFGIDPRTFEYNCMHGENVWATYLKGEANPGQLFFQIVLSLTPKYSVTNNLMKEKYKTILSLNDRSNYTFETSKKTNNCFM